jgi:hypothetical protein
LGVLVYNMRLQVRFQFASFAAVWTLKKRLFDDDGALEFEVTVQMDLVVVGLAAVRAHKVFGANERFETLTKTQRVRLWTIIMGKRDA